MSPPYFLATLQLAVIKQVLPNRQPGSNTSKTTATNSSTSNSSINFSFFLFFSKQCIESVYQLSHVPLVFN